MSKAGGKHVVELVDGKHTVKAERGDLVIERSDIHHQVTPVEKLSGGLFSVLSPAEARYRYVITWLLEGATD